MRKIVFTYGLLAGAIVSLFMVIGLILMEKDVVTFEGGELLGYATMVIALSMIFLGIKSYRDNHQKGALKFGKGLQIGALITLIGSLIYATVWETYYQSSPEVQTSFISKYTERTLEKMKAKGASQAELDQKAREMAGMAEMYKNPLIRFGFTMLEILPVGILITLICAAVLRRKSSESLAPGRVAAQL